MSKKLFGKFFIFLLVVGLLFAVAPTGQAEAATYTDWVAQVPAAPTSADTVRVWINSDTALGETVLVEYRISGVNTKVEGFYDTSYTGATWRADIPAQPVGTLVEYQLITRNQSGVEYRWSGFNWSYTVAAAPVLPVHNSTQNTFFSTIQAAIDAAASGDVIEVAPGEYAEYVELRTPNITVRSTDGAAVTKIVTPPGTLTTGVKVLANMGTVTFEGFTVKNFTESGIIQGMADRTGTTFHVLNNIVQPYADYLRNGIQVSGDRSTVVGNTVYGKRLTDEWASAGITVANASNVIVLDNTVIGGETGVDNGIVLIAFNNDMTNITIEGNTITDAFDGVNLQGNYWSATRYSISDVTIKSNIISDSSEGIGAYWLTNLTTVVVENNQFNNLVYGGLWIDGSVVGTVTGVDASPNWWGSAVGPDQTSADVDVYILGDPVDPAVYTPWCADADCETFAPDVDGNVYLSGPISGTGGILIGTPGLTYHLAADTVIQNNSPCFVIEASNTIIEAEPGAKCIPTGGSNGIDVAAGLNNITIDGLEIDGTGQTTGDGIHFAGAVSNIVLVDNNIHDLGSDGIEFAGDVSEVVEIQGNMFKGNLGLGINNLGANTVGAEYNSWGNVAGPAAGDGVSTKVTYEPFTHADLYVVSSGTPWANQVVTGQNITYTVMANLVNVNAADFYLEYPTNLTYVSHTDANALGINDEVTHDSATRKLHFIGYSTTGNKTGDLALFSVTFTANSTVLDAPLSFSYAATSGFGMVGYESSSNVFVNEMVNGSVTIVTLPTITSTDIQGYYLTGEQRQFSVVLNNPTGGADYAHVYVDYKLTGASLAQISLLEYSVDGGTTWVALGVGPGTTYGEDGLGNVVGYFGKIDGGGFPLAPGASLPTLFRVTFVTREQGATDFPTSYAVSMQLRDADALPDSYLLDELTDTMYVYDPATVTIAGDQYYIVDEPGAFTVTINNPTTGKNYDNTVVFDIVIADHVPADISALSCSMSGYTWDLLSSLTAVGSDVVARIEGADGFFTVPPTGVNMVVSCSVTYATAGNYVTSGEMVDVFDAVTPQERVVSTNISATAIVYTAPVITATFPTGPYVAGEPVTVPISITNPSGIPGPFSLVLNLPAGTTIVYNGVTYTCTDAGCPAIPVTLPIPTADLIITFPEGWTGDISMNLYDTSWDPDRLLATFTKTGVTVLGAFDVNGTVSMQGRSARAGVPLTLTGTSGTYNTTSTSLISNNYVFEDVAEGTYTFTTNQPRYLNITADLGKTVTLKGAKTLSSLWLRGGNAVYTDNEVNDTDLGKVSLGYTEGITTHPDADVNFDNKINIQDLALVGGNYLLTSDDAYADWQP